MTMSIDQLLKMPRATLLAFAALAILALGGCQHGPPSKTVETPTTWRVLERVGSVQATMGSGGATDNLRPGASITGAHRISTGQGALLILASDGMQLTAGENTAFSIQHSSSTSDLALDQGWLRVRLTRPADRKAWIKTEHFDINASTTTLKLRAGPLGDDLVIEAGSATIATPDGRHHANLVAGAAAKVDQASSRDLLIKRASARAFSKVTPLEATMQDEDHRQDRLAPTVDRQPAGPMTEPSPGSKPMAAVAEDDRQIIRPASRLRPLSSLKAADDGEDDLPPAAGSVRNVAASNWTAASMVSERDKTAYQGHHRLSASSMPGPYGQVQETETIERPASPVDPLQLQFDRLTEGLLDGI